MLKNKNDIINKDLECKKYTWFNNFQSYNDTQD